MPFLPTIDVDRFDIVTVWRAIQSIQLPFAPTPTEAELGPRQPTAEAIQAGKAKRNRVLGHKLLSPALVLGGIVAFFAAPALWWLWLLCAGVPTRLSNIFASRRTFRISLLPCCPLSAVTRLLAIRATGAFSKKKKQLEALKGEWNSLPACRAARLQELERDCFNQQLEKYLENFFIELCATGPLPRSGPTKLDRHQYVGVP